MTFDLQEAVRQLANINPGRMAVREFRTFLETYLRAWCPDVKVKMVREKMNKGVFTRPRASICYVSGMYDPDEDKDGFPCITIYITISDDTKELKLEVIHWHFFIISIIETLLHEKVHQRQFRERNFKPGKRVAHHKDHRSRYLADPDEVEAFACSAAVVRILLTAGIDHLSQEYEMSFGSDSKVFIEFVEYRTKYLNSLGDAHA